MSVVGERRIHAYLKLINPDLEVKGNRAEKGLSHDGYCVGGCGSRQFGSADEGRVDRTLSIDVSIAMDALCDRDEILAGSGALELGRSERIPLRQPASERAVELQCRAVSPAWMH